MGQKGVKYLELVEWIRARVVNKELLPGDKLDSENELSEKFHLSRQTVRHAISILVNEGLLKRVQGSGTYVNDERVYKKGSRVAVITTYVDGYIFPKLISRAEEMLSENGYAVQIAFTNNLVEKEREIITNILRQDDIAGVIVEATKSGLPNPNISLFKELMKRRIPLLFINSYYPALRAPHVSLNDRLAAKKIVEYLIGKGHKKIGGMFKLDDGQGHLRYSGYMEAMNQACLPTDDEKVLWFDTKDFRHLETSRDRILLSMKDCTAYLCYNDEVACALTKLLKQEGIRVPEDISIVGIDDSELAVTNEVKLTSVSNPIEEVVRASVENLMIMIRNTDFNGNYEVEGEIKERDSVKRKE